MTKHSLIALANTSNAYSSLSKKYEKYITPRLYHLIPPEISCLLCQHLWMDVFHKELGMLIQARKFPS